MNQSLMKMLPWYDHPFSVPMWESNGWNQVRNVDCAQSFDARIKISKIFSYFFQLSSNMWLCQQEPVHVQKLSPIVTLYLKIMRNSVMDVSKRFFTWHLMIFISSKWKCYKFRISILWYLMESNTLTSILFTAISWTITRVLYLHQILLKKGVSMMLKNVRFSLGSQICTNHHEYFNK